MSSVGIIGAGFAGLSTAKVLDAFGYDVTVFEKEADVGGVWSASRRYPGLTTQNPRETYELSDYPMPKSYPEWPSGRQVQEYLQSYTEHFGIDRAIRLNHKVEAATLVDNDSAWRVKVRNTANNNETQEHCFDYLIVCNGIFSIPFIPDFPGAKEFTEAGGRICHTSQFTDVKDAEDKHVLVIGYGKSSCDAANATVGVSRKTTVVARNLIWKIPKKLQNILNFKYLFLTRMGEGLFRYIRVRGFEKFLHGAGKPIRNSMLNSVEAVIARQLRLRKIGLHPNKPLETIARSTVSLVTDGFYENISAGKLGMEKAEVAELRQGEVKLTTGKTLPADILICGTGWDQQVSFFDTATTAKITDSQGNFRLYRTMIPVGVPRLMFNGYNSSFFSQLNAEIGALWLVEYLAGNITMPGTDEMNRQIDERLAWTEARTDGKHSKGTNIIPFSVHQLDELQAEIDLKLGRFKRFTQWFMPVIGSDYRSLTRKLLRRHNLSD